MGIAEQLKDARKRAGMTQKDVEEKTNAQIKANTVSNWEQGVSRPDVDSVSLLCKLYGVDPNDIFEWEDNTPDPSDELTEYLDELHKRPEMKMLFKVASKATKEDVEKAVKIIEMFKGNSSDGDDI